MASTMKLHIISPKDEIVEEFFQKEEHDSVLVFVKKRKYFVLLETRREFTINFKLVHAGNGMRKLNESLFEIYDKNPSNVKIASKIVEKDQNLSRVQNFFAFQFVSTSETFAGYNSTFKFIFTFTDDNSEVESQEFRVISRCMNSNKLISREPKNYSESPVAHQQTCSPQAGIPSKKRSPQAFREQENAMMISEKEDETVVMAEPAPAANTYPSMMVESGTSAKKLKMMVNPSVSVSPVFQTQEVAQTGQPQEMAPNNMVSAYPSAQPQPVVQQAPQLDMLVQLQQMLGTLIAQQQQQLQQQQQMTAAATAQLFFPQQQNAHIAFQLQQQLQHLQQLQHPQPQPQYIYHAPAPAATQYIMMQPQHHHQHQPMYVQQPTMVATAAPAAYDMMMQPATMVKQQLLAAPMTSSHADFTVDDMENIFGADSEFSMA